MIKKLCLLLIAPLGLGEREFLVGNLARYLV
jgi:hypothetical protein